MTITAESIADLKATAAAIPALIAAIPPHRRFRDTSADPAGKIARRAAVGALVEVVACGWMSVDAATARAAGMPVFSQVAGEDLSAAIDRHRQAIAALVRQAPAPSAEIIASVIADIVGGEG